MCLLLETIKIEDGEIRNPEYHNRRFNASRRALFGDNPATVLPGKSGSSGASQGIWDPVDLSTLIKVPPDLASGIIRCRVLYRQEIEKIEFIPQVDRVVHCLKLVEANDIEYFHKYADRRIFESLLEKRGDCDEILIVKNGFITDTSISNIVFRRTDGSWVTPDTPLLNGTMRMFLLQTGKISEAAVTPADLGNFTAAKMINCMMDLDSGPVIEMHRIMA